jgi:hypothetical protein
VDPGLTTRRRTLWIVATILALCVFLYRFNALGGSFGGFDNDHFIQFALAKQVEAGAQPLRDFSDAVHGARPSLTYELSAAAQRWLGDNFLSEALLTVSGVTLAAVITFLTGARLGPWPLALLMAVLCALLSPKLYGYPKVIVLAVTSLLIVRYAEQPVWRRAAALGVWTSVAFLFRHDYAVYVGAGSVAVLAAAHRLDPRTALRHVAGYGLLVLGLLVPSLLWVQYHAGIPEYVRNALEISAREAARTRLNTWPSFALAEVTSVGAFFADNDNTRAWLFYLLHTLPWVGAAAVVWRWVRRVPDPQGWTAAVAGLSVLTGVSARFFLRGNLPARFSEVAPAAAVLAVALLTVWAARGTARPAAWAVRLATAILLVSVTAASIFVLLKVPAEFRSARFSEPDRALPHTLDLFGELRALPRELRERGGERMQAADYLYRCTKPTDRVLVFAYAAEVEVFAERLFAGGRAAFMPGYYGREKYSRDALAWLEHESVPIVIAEPPGISELWTWFAPLTEHLRTEYQDVGSVMMSGTAFRVLARRASVPTGVAEGDLPCFAA